MHDRMDAGQERMQDMKRMQDRTDAGQNGSRAGWMQDRSDAGQD